MHKYLWHSLPAHEESLIRFKRAEDGIRRQRIFHADLASLENTPFEPTGCEGD